jgi:hypothetical protein
VQVSEGGVGVRPLLAPAQAGVRRSSPVLPGASASARLAVLRVGRR